MSIVERLRDLAHRDIEHQDRFMLDNAADELDRLTRENVDLESRLSNTSHLKDSVNKRCDDLERENSDLQAERDKLRLQVQNAIEWVSRCRCCTVPAREFQVRRMEAALKSGTV